MMQIGLVSRHLKGVHVTFELILRSRPGRCEEELGCNRLGTRVVNLAHVGEKPLSENWYDNDVCPEKVGLER
jgi:hypothetical protein